MGGAPDESRLVGNKEDKKMFEKESREKLNKIKAFLLELLIDGRCPLDVESNGAETSTDNGTDNDSK